jgi:hypothetical protein
MKYKKMNIRVVWKIYKKYLKKEQNKNLNQFKENIWIKFDNLDLNC